MQDVFRFLEVEDSFWTPAFTLRLNETRYRRRKNQFGRWLEKLNRLALVQRIPFRWRVSAGKYLYRPFSEPVSVPSLDEASRQELVAMLREDINRFRDWTSLSFHEWSM